MPHKISLATPHLAYILSLLQDGMSWSDIEQSDLVKLYHGDRDVYEWENGGSGLTEKVVSYLNPFMSYTYSTINDYMQSYQPTTQDALDDWRVRPLWQVMQFPRVAYREFTVLDMDYYKGDRHENIEIIFDKCGFFFYTYGKNLITHMKKEY